MSADLAVLLASRNAWIRAWAACGVPVAGGWEPCDWKFVAWLRLRCTACGWYYGNPWTPGHGAVSLRDLAIIDRAAKSLACTHLAPLRLPPAAEVEAAYKIELLAGGGV